MRQILCPGLQPYGGERIRDTRRAGYGCGNVYFTPKYSHGWSGTSLSGFSITIDHNGPPITANYTNSSSSWQGYGTDSGNYNVC